MTKLIRFIIPAIASIAFISCGGENQQQGSGVPEYPVIEVSTGNYTGFQDYPAKIEGIQNIQIRAKVSGYIAEILVDEGETVKSGQALFQLETASLSQDAEAAKSTIETAKAQVEAAQLEVEKLEPLVKKEVISEMQLATAKADLNSAKAQLKQAKSNYQSITANVGYAKIISPVDGVVGKINMREGSLVGPTTSQALTTVANISRVYAYFSLNEREFLDLTKKLEGTNLMDKLAQMPKVKLQLADGSDYEHKGTIDASTGNIDPETGSIQLRAIFENPNRILRNGSSGIISLPREYKDAIAIPALSTFERQGKRLTYLINGGDSLRSRPIEVQDEVGKYFIISRGLKEGDRILAKGVGKVRSGAQIKPKIVPMDSIVNSFSTVFK
ncbi:efflux RND transporter periplasmic adaptor subunit [Salibacter halophilus]|uniref:Efflux RND transporter periplasmic adaptor subunit n=1 Tax=Salibacter halophilus TaxID=1803916 RepID=A0A6N6M700_9FLAO|nr:efflux RND transporter periplasmic adaptor subunit [Salibacter halophilus]KAB1065694.1 efflux RND transporter periplasmic adaptor subunit [Salibacter halophilus]